MIRKNIFAFFLFGFISVAFRQSVQIGNGSEVNIHLPVAPFYKYTYSQQIYLASEIGDYDGGTITELKFYFGSGNGISNSNYWTVYIGHTNKTEFTSSTDWVPTVLMTQVFSGDIGVVDTQGWVTIDINDWVYNGTDNIVIAVDENDPFFDDSNDDFYCTQVSSNQSIEVHSDTSNPDPDSPPSGNVLSYIPNIIFEGLEQGCPPADNLTGTPISGTEAVLQWDTNGGNEWNLEWGLSGFTPGSGNIITGLTSPTYTVSGLNNSTTYDFYVTGVCTTENSITRMGTWSQPPENNTCNTAISIPVNATCSPQIVSNTGATDSGISSPACGSYQGTDVWFSFTTSNNPGNFIHIETSAVQGGNLLDPAMAIYSGDCNNLSIEACDDNSGTNNFSKITIPSPLPDTTYYIRLWSSGNSPTGEANLCVYDPSLASTASLVKEDFYFYPMPVQEYLYWESSLKVEHLEIYDFTGKKVYQLNTFPIHNKLNIGFLKNGIYFIKVQTKTKKGVFKIIKK